MNVVAKYLIDTDILIDFFKKKYNLNQKIKSVGLSNCFVSEITIAELTFGALKSTNYEKQNANIQKVKSSFTVIPISGILERYAKERLRLEKLGSRLPDFDLLIAVTSVEHQMVLVSGNEKHHSRIEGIQLENWRNITFNSYIQ